MINATICFFTHLLLVILISIYDVRKYNGAYLSCAYVPRRKKNQFPANTAVIRSCLKLQGKY